MDADGARVAPLNLKESGEGSAPSSPVAPPTFIDLFSGCGGLSLGLMKAGWKGLFAIERDTHAFKTLSTNLIEGTRFRYDWPEWLPKSANSIHRVKSRFREQLAALRGKVTLIAGGPPCQGFSLAGRRSKTDPRNVLFRHYMDIVELIKPPLILLENVRGITVEFGKKKAEKRRKKRRGRPPIPFSDKIRNKLDKLGYAVHPKLLRAADFGVPQFRPRFFLVAILKTSLPATQTAFDPYAKLHDLRLEFLKERKLPLGRAVKVREAIGDLRINGQRLIPSDDSEGFMQISRVRPTTTYQRLLNESLNDLPNSMRLARHTPKVAERFEQILKTCRRGVQVNVADRERLGIKKMCTVPLDGERPSHTLTTLPDDLIHYSEPRILTAREYARLQSFPDWFAFKGKYNTGGELRKKQCPRYTQIGNAVPPFLSEVLGTLLKVVHTDLSQAQTTAR